MAGTHNAGDGERVTGFEVVEEPPRGAIGDLRPFQHPGFEALRRMAGGSLPGPPPSRLLGSRVTDVGLGTVSFAMPVTRWLEDSHRLIEAGIFALFADAPLASALWTGLPAGKVSTTSELNMSFVRPATEATTHVVGRAETIHLGRQIGLSAIRVSDQTGRLLAHGTTKCLIADVPVDPGAVYPEPDTGPDDPPDPYLREGPPEDRYYSTDELTGTRPVDLMRASAAGERRFPVWSLTGFRPEGIGDGTAVGTIPASAWFSNGGPSVYGGVLAWFADHVMGAAVFSTQDAGDLFAPLDLNVRYTRPALIGSGDLTATAEVRHRGRRLRVSACEIRDAAGRTVAMATSSALAVPGGAAALVAGRTPDEIIQDEEQR